MNQDKNSLTKNKKKINKIYKFYFTRYRISIFIIILIILGVSFVFNNQIESIINPNNSQIINISDDQLKVHFIDVGQGDAILLELPDDKLMLIDSGDNDDENKLLKYLENNIFSTRQDLEIDYFMVTHNDMDHIGEASEVIEKYKILTFYRPNQFYEGENTDIAYNTPAIYDGKNYKEMLLNIENEGSNQIVSKSGLEIKSGEVGKEHDGYKITFLSPNESTYTADNNYSPVLMVEYKTTKFLLTGDAEKEVEDTLIEFYKNNNWIDVDVLKVGHHGSNTSTSEEFLDMINPEYAVISCGKDNKYGHPTNQTLNNLQESGIAVENLYRTDINGSVIAGFDQNGSLVMKAVVDNEATYIHWYYIVITLGVVSFLAVFSIPLKTNKKGNKI